MPHGSPDFWQHRAATFDLPINDIAELAAYMGYIVTHDKRGDVIWIDHFGGGLVNWTTSALGTNAEVATSPLYPQTGGYTVRHICGSAIDLITNMSINLDYPAAGRYGYEASFTIAARHTYFQIILTLDDGTNTYRFILHYNTVTNRVEYQDDTPALVPVGPVIVLSEGAGVFHRFKLVLDLHNHIYKRCVLDYHDINLYDAAATVGASSGAAFLALSLEYNGTLTFLPVGYVDNVILTQNEP